MHLSRQARPHYLLAVTVRRIYELQKISWTCTSVIAGAVGPLGNEPGHSPDKIRAASEAHDPKSVPSATARDGFARISDFSLAFNTLLTGNSTTTMTIPFQPKGMHDEMNAVAFDDYG